jgi:hypothetical protein
MVFVVTALVGVALVVLVAWLSDRRDRRAGRTEFRSTAEMWKSGRQARRQMRWRREQINRGVVPPRDLDDGER